MNLPEGLIAVLHEPSTCVLSALRPDGSPQMTRTWVDSDGQHVVINTVQDHQKARNVERDPRVAVRYLGTAYPWYGGRDQVRVLLTIRADKIRAMG